ncbi:MAG: hypothetical protein JHC26_11515 [Thermofilum sp.]|jgi:hypothetical protein|uniref:hypothetical protein n=1 Tax=Thermofilum sp. TaxID=1961369 RepID=UPI002587248B|nr:hypothetical protein [Thermofilum sp.]MCI4409710.1 hypothetical protein [Thermofilum sp.]
MEDLKERLLLTLKYLKLYGKITAEISELDREISNIISKNTVNLKRVPGTDNQLGHEIHLRNRLLELPEWYKFFYGLQPESKYTLQSIYLFYDHMIVALRDEHGEDAYEYISTVWMRLHYLVFLSILEDEEWKELLDVAKRYNNELYDNLLVYREVAPMLKDVVNEPEPDVKMRSFDVEKVVFSRQFIEDVVARAKKALGKPPSIVFDELSIFEDPYMDNTRYVLVDITPGPDSHIIIDMRLSLNKEVVLPKEVAHTSVFLPSTSLTVKWVDVFFHSIRMQVSYNIDVGSSDSEWTVIRGGKINMATLVFISYTLSEDVWKKIIEKLTYCLWFTEITLRKLKKASAVMDILR